MEIKNWFEEKDYGIGLAILGSYSKNRMLLQNLSRKPNAEKLEYELRKVAELQGIVIDANEETDEIKEGEKDLDKLQLNGEQSHSDMAIDQMNAEAIPSRNIIRAGSIISPDDLPAEIKQYWLENNDLYKEVRSTHEKLKLMENASDEDRAPLAKHIAEMDDKIRTNWEVIDAWVPGTEIKPETVLVIDHKRINANRKFISTNLKALAATPEDPKAAAIILKIQERYDELKNAMEAFNPETIDELTKAGILC